MAVSTTIKRTPVLRVQTRYLVLLAGSFAALAILAGFFWLTWAVSPFVIDDAFISFRYAENLVHGHGLVFNPSERVEGYTNFLWVMLVAGSNALGGDSLVTAKTLGILANLATLILVGLAMARGWLRPVVPGLALLPPLLLVANFGFVLWGVGGLETPLFTCLVTAGLLCLARASEDPVSTRNFYWAGGLFALAVLARPDAAVLYAGAVLGWGVWAVMRGRPKRAVVGRLLIGVSIFLGVLWAHTLFRYLYYGDWVPNTIHIKAPTAMVFDTHWRALTAWLHPWSVLNLGWLAPLDAQVAGLPDLWRGLITLLTTPGVWLAVAALWSARRRSWAWVLAGACVAWLLYLSRIYPDWMPGWRYFQPILPMFTVLIALGFGNLLTAAARLRGSVLRYGASIAVAALAVGLVALSLSEFNGHQWEIPPHAGVQRGYRAVGEYLRDHAWPGSTLAVTDAGSVPYYSGLFTIDYAGLTDKHMALVPYRIATVDKGDGIIRHYEQMRYDPQYVLGRRPDFVYFAAEWLPGGRLKCRFPEQGQLYQAMLLEGTYDFENPVYYQDGNVIIKRKDVAVMH